VRLIYPQCVQVRAGTPLVREGNRTVQDMPVSSVPRASPIHSCGPTSTSDGSASWPNSSDLRV
jgi:hypothetical protein